MVDAARARPLPVRELQVLIDRTADATLLTGREKPVHRHDLASVPVSLVGQLPP